MKALVIIGASGFLGRSLINSVNSVISIKAIVRSIPSDIELKKNITWVKSSLTRFSSLASILSKGDIVVNLAYIDGDDKVKNVALLSTIIKACQNAKVSRLVHCSTAAVIGNIKTKLINELSMCNPISSYEKTKLILENQALNALSNSLDVVILRPTAIVGSGGKNLLKLKHSLFHGWRFINFLKKCVLNKMPMHLVPVRNVISAILHLSFYCHRFNGEVFIVSDDDDPDNNYERVYNILSKQLGLTGINFPFIPLPKVLQLILFKVINRNDINMSRTFDSKKLYDYGFIPVDSVSDAICQFVNSIELLPSEIYPLINVKDD